MKKEVEDKFENEKWYRIAEAIKSSGGGKYPPAAVQRKFKEIQKKMASVKAEKDSAIGASKTNKNHPI